MCMLGVLDVVRDAVDSSFKELVMRGEMKGKKPTTARPTKMRLR